MNKLIVLMVLAGLLIFGCTSQQPGPSGTVNTTAPAASGATAPVANTTGGAAAPSGGTPPAPANTTSGTASGTPSGTGAGTNIGSIESYVAAMTSGLPLECTAMVNGQPLTIEIKGQNMYMKMTSAGQTYEMVYKNSTTYMKVSTQMQATFAQMGKNCNWLTFAANSTSTSGTAASSPPVSTSSVESSSVVWSCKPGLFGDDIFLTPGSACSMSDLYSGASVGVPPSVPTGSGVTSPAVPADTY